MEVRTNRSGPGSQPATSHTTDTARLSHPGPPPACGVLPSPASPGPQRAGNSPRQPASAHSRSPSRGTPGEAPTSRLLSQQRADPALGDVRGGWNVGFCPPPLQPPRLVGHQILLIVSQMCLVSRPSPLSPGHGEPTHKPSKRSEKGPKRRDQDSWTGKTSVVQDSQEGGEVISGSGKSRARCEGTEETWGLGWGEL